MTNLYLRTALHETLRGVLQGFGPTALLRAALILPWWPALHGQQSSLRPVELQVEARVNPVGLDSPHPRLSWRLAATEGAGRGLRQTGYRVLVAGSLRALERDRSPERSRDRGRDRVSDLGQSWDSGRVRAEQRIEISCGCAGLRPLNHYYWKVMVWDQAGRPSGWSAPASWYTGNLGPAQWQAHWIAAAPDLPAAAATREGVDLPESAPQRLPLFRREFRVASPVESATLAVTGLGQYELRVNGVQVTASVMNPGWTDYRKRVLYNVYDVAGLLRPGANALGVMLGNGMYAVPQVARRYTKFSGSYGQPKLLLQLRIRYRNGSVTDVVTDGRWTCAPGPITFSSIYGGEDYDARLEQAGWQLPGFAAPGWQPASVVAGPGGALVAEQVQPLIAAHEYSAVSSKRMPGGSVVYDLGENFSGWPNLVAQGPAGSRVKLLPGELLDATGHVTQASNNAHPNNENSFSYTLKGAGIEQWHPQFSYNGFRYVEVSREGPAQVISVTGSFLHDDVAVTGTFVSSDTLLVSIHKLIDQAIESNMVSVLTDCPTREKLGWLEQTHLAATSIMYNYDVQSLYEKMAADMGDAQLADGLVPSIAPEYVAFVDKQGRSTAFRDSPEWGSAIILSPLAAYRFYGDTVDLAGHYEQMKKYVAYLEGKAQGSILSYGLGDWYDMGPGEPGESQLTSRSVTATATYYEDLAALSQIAGLVGRQGDAQAYAKRAREVKAAFNLALFHPDTAQYDRGSQTADAMPLALGLVPEDRREAVLANLIADIRSHGNHITAGDIGYHYVVRALTDGGRSDVLEEMLQRIDPPSYGYQLTQGATSLTEAWDAKRTSSQNHLMLGHAEEWFYRGLAGIDIDMTRIEGERIRIAPRPVPQVQQAEVRVRTVMGEVRSRWQKLATGTVYELTVPAGEQAIVLLPVDAGERFTENGAEIQVGKGILSIERRRDAMKIALGSGSYSFLSRK